MRIITPFALLLFFSIPTASCANADRNDFLNDDIYSKKVISDSMSVQKANLSMTEERIKAVFDIHLFKLKGKYCSLLVPKKGVAGEAHATCFYNESGKIFEYY